MKNEESYINMKRTEKRDPFSFFFLFIFGITFFQISLASVKILEFENETAFRIKDQARDVIVHIHIYIIEKLVYIII